MPFQISLLFLDCCLTGIQDGDSSSGDRKDSDVIIKSEVVETKFIPGTVMPLIQIVFG